MDTIQTSNRRHRTKRHRRWLWAVLGAMAVASASAANVYRCTTAGGAIAFQDHACAPGQRQAIVHIKAAAAYAPPPHYALSKHSRRRSARRSRRRRKSSQSYECRASDGEVFYRHGGCPNTVTSPLNPRRRVHVSARRIPREQACSQIRRAGAIGRQGHEHDQVVSTYDHDLGNDPCD